MWLEPIAQNLELKTSVPRRFCLCLSGGLDSTVMAYALSSLRKLYPISIQAIHLHYGLRGKSSDRDALSVERLCEQLEIPLRVYRVKVHKKSAIQSQARSLRLKAISELDSLVEIIEAHHQDDQIETFFLNLFRGAGVRGLSSLKVQSMRESRRVWRPLLPFSKQQLRAIARDAELSWREDQSNRSTLYDRNFVRLKILPLIEKRFPHFRRSVASSIQVLQSWEHEATKNFELQWSDSRLVLARAPLTLSTTIVARWSEWERVNFFYYLFVQKLQIQVPRETLLKLSAASLKKPAVSVNLPKGIVARIRARQRLVFDGLKGVLGDDKTPRGIILS
jgi:tRNA(Ile)-lysidine synthetase-like protein